jgi:hypothetical protein
MASIPLQRSKALLEEQGWKVWKVEVWNQWSGHRVDLYHLMDLVAIRADVNGVLGVQCCGEDVAAHITKIMSGYTDPKGKVWGPNEYLPIWKAAGNKLLIHGWSKRGERGKRKVWTLREVQL